ncbi:MAG TPA: hypothetical protein ENI05_06025 [Porticoccus sp.]|nr:hypothetical protein [Porticoccus sp.]
MNSVADNLQSTGAAQALAALEKIKPKSRDKALYLLNRGSLKRYTGDLKGSNADLESAKSIMAALQATSVSESLAAVTINETLRSYAGTPSERILLHEMLAFNYLQLGDLDGARVEMLQADVTAQALAKADSLRGYLASDQFLSGCIYEMNGELDNAMISYRRALGIMDQRSLQIPLALQDSLLQISQRQRMTEEYQRYEKRFSRSAEPLEEGERELLVFYADGNVSSKQQNFIPIFSPAIAQPISLALPYYPPNNYRAQYLNLNVAGKFYRTQPIENIEVLAREDLDEAMPGITAATLLRATAKYQTVKAARDKKEDFAALLLLVANTVTEQADLRSWNMLPSSLQVARIRLGAQVDIETLALPNGMNASNLLSFNRGKTLVLLASSLDRNDRSLAKSTK